LEKEVQTTKIQQDQLAACHQAGSWDYTTTNKDE
jgi:hypothetical protein